MSTYASAIWNFLSHYRYLLVVIVAVLVIGVFDENSAITILRQQIEIAELEDEIESNKQEYERISAQIHEMNRDTKSMRKVARERFFMKEDDEDIFQIKYTE